MMRQALLFASLLMIVGCGGDPEKDPPLPFSDVAGTYQATVVWSSGIYAGLVAGSTIDVNVTALGALTFRDGASYQLSRDEIGSGFTIPPHTLGPNSLERGTASAELGTLTLIESAIDTGAMQSSAQLELVRMDAG
jgi:hypothetical protein